VALKPFRYVQACKRLGEVRDKLVVVVESRKLVQKVTNINLVSSQPAADGMCVNRESHARISSIAAYPSGIP
jgi:hypothetical protein